MIFDLLGQFIMRVFNWTLSILPTQTMPIQITAAFQSIGTSMKWVNNYFPISELMLVVAAFIFFELAYLALKIALWVFHLITGRSGFIGQGGIGGSGFLTTRSR